ncbi:hypothetical protein BOTBODRAFT_95129, partial [Botryobasidium botryosum FD-172 SS1]
FPYPGGWANSTLARHGFIGTSPIDPHTAISFKVLETYRALRGRAYTPRQAFVRTIDDLHGCPHNHSAVRQFSNAFDVYIRILCEVDRRIAVCLKRDDPDWRLKNSCPPCSYKCEDEPALLFERLLTVDGNNSLKRFRNAGAFDPRTFESNYFLTTEFVDKFQNEIKAKKKPTGSRDPTSGAPDSECTDRWKNTDPTHTKAMWKAFEESGIFACACRHGFIAIVADMIRSGELAKYPIAVTRKLLDVLGHNLGIGYDIGCAFCAT